MSNNNCKVEHNGAGIYGEINEANRNDETDNDERQTTTSNQNSARQNTTNQIPDTSKLICHSYVKQFDDILANIDKQSEVLDKIQSIRIKRVEQSPRRLSTSRENFPSIENSQSDGLLRKSGQLSSSSLISNFSSYKSHSCKGDNERERQQRLNRYINHSIRSGLDECGCCYRSNSNDRHLLNELSKCYSGVNHRHFLDPSTLSTISYNCHECLQQQHNQNLNSHVCLGQLAPSNRATRRPSIDEKQDYKDTLFIENNDDNHCRSTQSDEPILSTQITDYLGINFGQQIIESNNNDNYCNCCCLRLLDYEPTVTFSSERPATNCALEATLPAPTNNLEYSVLASSGYNYIFGPASREDSPTPEAGNALDRVVDSPCDHSWPLGQQQDYQATYQGTLSAPNHDQPSEDFADQEEEGDDDDEEAHLDCSLTYKSSEALSQSLDLKTKSDCTSDVGCRNLSLDFIATRQTSTWPPLPEQKPREDERTSIEWAARTRNSSRSDPNLTSLLLFTDSPSADCCYCNPRGPPEGRRQLATARDSALAHEQLDHSDESCASHINFKKNASELSFHEHKMGFDGNGNNNNNNGNEFISEKAGKLLGISPTSRGSNNNSASSPTSSSHDTSQTARATNLTSSEACDEHRHQRRRETDRRQEKIWPQRTAPDARAAPSMKVARDIAKMSAPSLASLQYLPGKVDKSAKKVSNNNNAANSEQSDTTKQNINKMDDGANSSTRQQQHQQHMATGAKKVLSDSSDDVHHQHDESSFLHRLCLCNCLSHHHQHQQRPQRMLGPNLPVAGAARSLSRSSEGLTLSVDEKMSNKQPRQRLLSGDDNQRNMAKRRRQEREEMMSGRMQTSQQRGAASQAARQDLPDVVREKQSPKFLGLLEQQQHSSPSNKKTHKSAPTGTNQFKRLGRADDDSLGSDGDLVASLSHELDNSLTTNDDDDGSHASSSLSPRRPQSTLSATLTDDGSYLNEVAGSSSPVSAKSAYSNAATKQRRQQHQQQEHNKKTSPYRKFLSPSKLFGGSQSPDLHETNDHPEQQEAGIERRCKSQQQTADSSSFLSRSLNRLSGKKNSTINKEPAASREDNQQSAPKCTSPTISNSPNTSQQDSFSDSVNSLEETSLPHSLPVTTRLGSGHRGGDRADAQKSRILTAPEIVLNKVEYTDNLSNYSTRSAGDMTHSNRANNHSGRRNYRHHHHHSSQAGANYGRASPGRQASEYSESIGDSSSFQGPFSLPGSPRSVRRHRSPRLSQSPVPFRSPANESSKIEDGLKVCSSEHFEKHIGNIKDNQVEAQKRLFTAWINHFCPNLIRRDLVDELQDGIKLIGLLASLTHDKSLLANYEKLNRDKQSYINRLVVTPSSRLKHLSNVSIAVDYLRKKLGMQLVNLNPMDIVSGKANVILGLCWNIILHFQLEQNYFKFPDSVSGNYSANSSDLGQSCTSRLSSGAVTNEDRSSRRNIGQMIRGTSASLMEEYTAKDLLTAKNRLLDHINKRFNLKLTRLSSNLVDGDVLLVIIKQLLAHRSESEHQIEFEKDEVSGKPWKWMDDDEKLDHCFHLANKHLHVPRLFSASDLSQQSLSENNSKPLLIYLSMLLSSSPQTCSAEQMIELQQVDATLTKHGQQQHQPAVTVENGQPPELAAADDDIESILRDVDTEDKYDIDKLQTTLKKIHKVDQLMAGELQGGLSESLIKQHAQLKQEANQVESLINWINRADKLFETSQKSSVELARAIQEYQAFFSPSNLPQVSVVLCPTLASQYRECLAMAKQRVLSMEQTMKNWLSYERARQDLKDWLLNAESKLSNALRPSHQHSNSHNQLVRESIEPIEQHLSRLEELIDYFELEQLDSNDDRDCDSLLMSCSLGPQDQSMSSASSLNFGQSSLSGSLISLGSTSSRLSTLTSSKKATYNRLFDDFELKCRLLAAILDSDQRDALLLGVKELKSRLKYITENRVPHVINELRFNINRCELSIKEQDETSDHENRLISKESDCSENLVEVNQPQDFNDLVVTDEASDEQEQEEQEELPAIIQTIKPLGKRKNRNKHKSRNNKNKATNQNKKNKTIAKNQDNDQPAETPKKTSYIRLLWNKIVRASRVSLSLNIVLLLCLAGICVVPLINRDACCELSQKTIQPPPEYSINQRPI